MAPLGLPPLHSLSTVQTAGSKVGLFGTTLAPAMPMNVPSKSSSAASCSHLNAALFVESVHVMPRNNSKEKTTPILCYF